MGSSTNSMDKALTQRNAPAASQNDTTNRIPSAGADVARAHAGAA